MIEEIKEIDLKKDFYLCSPLLNKECTKENCYINNGCCCHTVNKKYSQEHLLNYITNLQKKVKNQRVEIDGLLKQRDKIKIRHIYLKKDLKDYKQRNEKAVEYIKTIANADKSVRSTFAKMILVDYKILLNILEGGDE